MENNNEIKDDEIITVELGQEDSVKSVEEEIQAETPTEMPEETPSVKPEPDVPETVGNNDEKPEENVEEKEKDTESSSADTDSKAVDTTPSDKPSPEKEEDTEEKGEDNPDATPSPEPTEEPTEKSEDENEEVGEESQPDINEELEKARRELADIREQEETRKAVEEINQKAIVCTNQIADFNDKLSKALEDTFKQYDIDLNKTMDELKSSDPAKFAIAQELIGHAEAIRDQKYRELQAPVIEAQKSLVFKEASKVMCKYDLTDEQAQEAATTLIDIMNQVGLADIDKDLKAKVELAVAKAKMVHPDKKEEVKEVEENKPDEQAEQPTEAPSEEPTDAPTEAPKEEEKENVKGEEEAKVDIEAYKEGAATGDSIVNNREGVTVDNVLQKLASLPFKERGNFYKEYSDLINKAGIQRYRNQGLR